jgi:hypothetical protein
MARCWRCGGGKTISVTTTGTHVLPCPTCNGSGEMSGTQEPLRTGVGDLQQSDKAVPSRVTATS